VDADGGQIVALPLVTRAFLRENKLRTKASSLAERFYDRRLLTLMVLLVLLE
jgi:hypothetical protein